MGVKQILLSQLDHLRHGPAGPPRSLTIAAIGLVTAVLSLGIAEAAVRAEVTGPHRLAGLETADPTSGPAARITLKDRVVWVGADLDGDGQPDIANPTGQAPRADDAYGEGRFHASRDGGERQHEGVDYVANPGQVVAAPISGYVARIGYAYADDVSLRFVEIDNPALKLTARVFYVDPDVAVGDAVAVGHPIGHAHSLQRRYPLGITDHVHLEIADSKGRKLDAETLILARAEPGLTAAD